MIPIFSLSAILCSRSHCPGGMLGYSGRKASEGGEETGMKHAMTIDDAQTMMAAAEAEAVRNKWEVVIAILNDGGRIVAVHRMDGTRSGNDQIAITKATSAMTCRPSVEWIEGPHKAMLPFITAQGGLPLSWTAT